MFAVFFKHVSARRRHPLTIPETHACNCANRQGRAYGDSSMLRHREAIEHGPRVLAGKDVPLYRVDIEALRRADPPGRLAGLPHRPSPWRGHAMPGVGKEAVTSRKRTRSG